MAKKQEKGVVAKKEKSKNYLDTVQNIVEKIDDISKEMDLICSDKDTKNTFQNAKRMDLLEKNGNFKIKLLSTILQAQQQIKENSKAEPTPIKVEFVSPNTNAENDRISKLEEEVDIAMGKGGKA